MQKKQQNIKHAPLFFDDIWIGGRGAHRCEGMKINSRIMILKVLAITKYGKKSSDTLQNILEDKHETFRMEQGKGVKDRLGDEVHTINCVSLSLFYPGPSQT